MPRRFELWACLLSGERLVIAPDGLVDLEGLGRLLVEHGVTTLWLTAGLFHRMVEEQADALACLGRLLAGGDALSPAVVDTMRRRWPQVELINGYGPTENTTFTTTHSVTSEGLAATVPIGTPMVGTRIYVLDRFLNPVPIGAVGELYAAGSGLAVGYVRRPAQTACAFLPDPFGDEPGARMYRTGDLARWLPDGILECLGRVDHQVKIRGFRIEPGEIESHLRRQPDIADALVLVHERAGNTDTHKRLVALVVPTPSARPQPDALRGSLAAVLPGYMVPWRILVLERLPVTPNGKVDRAACLDLVVDLVDRDAEPSAHDAPRNDAEAALCDIWTELLGRAERPVGIHENFFDIGGDSILANPSGFQGPQGGMVPDPESPFPTSDHRAAGHSPDHGGAAESSTGPRNRPRAPGPRSSAGSWNSRALTSISIKRSCSTFRAT